MDGRSRRIARKVDGVVTARWLYKDQLNPVAQLDGDGNLEWQYVYASKPHVPDYAIRVSDGAVYRIVSDQLGSVVLVVNVADASDVLLAARYSAFGSQEVIAGSSDAVPFGFAGGLYDAATGLTRFGARDYDARTGRWTAKDPIRFRSRVKNPYVYANDEPVNTVDLTGRHPWPDDRYSKSGCQTVTTTTSVTCGALCILVGQTDSIAPWVDWACYALCTGIGFGGAACPDDPPPPAPPEPNACEGNDPLPPCQGALDSYPGPDPVGMSGSGEQVCQ